MLSMLSRVTTQRIRWQKQYRSLDIPSIVVANKIDQAQVAHEQCYQLDNTEIVYKR